MLLDSGSGGNSRERQRCGGAGGGAGARGLREVEGRERNVGGGVLGSIGVQAALGRNTSRAAGQQAPGQIAYEKWLTARSSATRRER